MTWMAENPLHREHMPQAFKPEFSATTVIDLKGLLGTIKQAKGEGQLPATLDEDADLLDIFAAQAESLRESRAEPEKIMPVLLGKVGLPKDDVLWGAAIRASEIAGENQDNHPSYHSPHHVTEVILAAYCLGMREHLPKERVVELLVAAAAHDLGHTGAINKVAYELETLAYHIIHPVLVECGLSEESIERIGRMIVSTDFVNGVPMVRQAYRHYHDHPVDNEDRLLSAQCVILTEADILFSCFSEHYNDRLSKLLSVEWNRQENLSLKERIGFLSSVEFISDAAIQLGLEERRKKVWQNLTRRTGRIPYPADLPGHPVAD
jgi:hypothetical protein